MRGLEQALMYWDEIVRVPINMLALVYHPEASMISIGFGSTVCHTLILELT